MSEARESLGTSGRVTVGVVGSGRPSVCVLRMVFSTGISAVCATCDWGAFFFRAMMRAVTLFQHQIVFNAVDLRYDLFKIFYLIQVE
jgi:hypothetical protein